MKCIHLSLKILSINFWKIARKLHSPKNIVVGSNTPSSIINAIFFSPYFIQIFRYFYCISNFEKIIVPLTLSISIWGLGIRYLFLTVNL